MLFILLIALSFYVAYLIINDGGSSYWWGLFEFLFFMLIGGMFSLLAGLITFGVAELSDKQVIRTEHCNVSIVSLANDSRIEGHFVMGSGYLNGSSCYSVFYNEKGGLAKWNFPTDDTIIYQDSPTSKEARIEYDKNFYHISNMIIPWDEIIQKDTTYMVHVPANTVIERFEVK